MQSGLIFNIQKFSIQDGPGIRTTVFFKGCPASCPWCHNPESQSSTPQILLHEGRCIQCGSCLEVCPEQDAVPERGRAGEGEAHCIRCGACVEACPSGARSLAGTEMSVREVVQELLADRVFYDQSGGGVTFSGGEPLMQLPFLRATLEACRSHGLHTAVDTCGHVPTEQLGSIVPLTDLFLYDLKLMEERRHLELTGIPNTTLLPNLRMLAELQAGLCIRVPIIPGINDDDENINAMASFVAALDGAQEVELLPYHRTGIGKFERLGRHYPLRQTEVPSNEHMTALARHFQAYGIEPTIRG
jgi:pyruvate formate lyase activating enzyme